MSTSITIKWCAISFQYDAFRLGQEFAVNFPDSMEELIDVKLKSGFGSARHHQGAESEATLSEQHQCQETEKYSPSIPYEVATSTLGLNQQSPQCNSANSERQSDAKTHESDAMYTQSDQYQSILGTDGSPNNSSSCQINHSIDTKHPAQEAHTTHVTADNQQVQNVSGHSYKGMHTQTDLYVESSKVNAARQPVDQTNTESVESAGIRSQRKDTDTDKSSRNSHTSELRSSDEKTGLKHESSSKTVSSSAHDKNSKNSNHKWKPTKEEYAKLREDALHFMRGVMDLATFVGNFSKPVDPELVCSILANQDAYIPWQQMPNLAEMWPGMEVS